MTPVAHRERDDAPGPPPRLSAAGADAAVGVRAMLEARSVAVVGASARPGSFGARMVDQVCRSASRPSVYLVNPRYTHIGELSCHRSLADLPEPVDLVLLGVPDSALEAQLTLAARRGDRSAVIFGTAADDVPGCAAAADPPALPSLRERLASIAASAGMALCGAGCMGFVNVTAGLRAVGYVEPDPLPSGPVALVTHSGSVFSALLRTRRGLGYTVAVSSGQELVTTAPQYLEYALSVPETRVLGLVLEALRDGGLLRRVLAAAAERALPVVLLTVGRSARGREFVTAHSGALAGADGSWEALSRAYGVHRVDDLAELADTLELFAVGRAVRAPDAAQAGIATVHDSGLERAHAADLAERLGVRYAAIGEPTVARLAELLDPGLVPANPLDVWGRGANTRSLFAESLAALAGDPAVAAVALAVDLVPELDGDDSYPLAAIDAAERTDKHLAVLAGLPGAVDQAQAARLRGNGVPVLEGTRTGLLALRHLLEHATRPAGVSAEAPAAPRDSARRRRARSRLGAAANAGTAPLFALLDDYGIARVRAESVTTAAAAAAAAAAIGYPVVLKTDEPAIAHKSDVGGVLLGIADPDQLAAGYTDLTARLGPRVLVCQTAPPGVELALGIIADPALGPLIVVGAGGTLVELLADRVVALPPVDSALARDLLAELKVSAMLAGQRGAPPADLDAIVRAITGLSDLALDLADELVALDINPLICSDVGAFAADVLAVRRDPH